ncbi:DUF7691 family protein [Nocardia tengchongensis]
MLHVYLVDVDVLTAVIGSKDEKLLRRVLGKFPDQAGLGPALVREIFEGGPFQPERAKLYVEALELICGELGRFVGDTDFRFSSAPDDILELAHERRDAGPWPESDGAGWGSWDKESCAELLAELLGEVEDDEYYEDDEYEDEYVELRLEWLRASKKANKDLIGFWGASGELLWSLGGRGPGLALSWRERLWETVSGAFETLRSGGGPRSKSMSAS